MTDTYIITYEIDAPDIERAVNAIVLGQSVGNPDIRSPYENERIRSHSARAIDINGNIARVEFQYKNLNNDFDIAQILCTIQGGQSDIDYINGCRITDIEFNRAPLAPVVQPNRDVPIIGGIIKPKTGITAHELAEITREMLEGGVEFIKEDEILSDPDYLPLSERVKIIEDIRKDYKHAVYAYCVNGNPQHLINQMETVKAGGGEAIHINFWSGLGSYHDSNKLGLFTHFQRSGIRILTDKRNPWGIDWEVFVKIAIQQGIDSIHVGMIGGYYPQALQAEALNAAKLCIDNGRYPTLSCGMTPVEAKNIQSILGNNWIANVGGWLHSSGTIKERVEELKASFN